MILSFLIFVLAKDLDLYLTKIRSFSIIGFTFFAVKNKLLREKEERSSPCDALLKIHFGK